MGSEIDVVVLGAGMAGLTAAAELKRTGLDVLVVEARGRVGGRVHTLHDARTPVPLELGPELVHEGADAVHRLVRELDLALHELEGPTWVHRRRHLTEMPGFDEHVKRGLGAAFARLPARSDLSMKDALARAVRLTPEVRELTRSFVEGFHAGPMDRVGARALAKGGAEGRGRSLRVHVGYGAVAEGLAGRLAGCIRLGTTVKSVHWRRREVTILAHGPTGHETTLRARAVVVALPLGVLRAPEGEQGSVTFDPPLEPGVSKALARLDMGHVVKIALRFREAFWTDPKLVKARGATKEKLAKTAFFHDPRGPFPTFWTTRPLAAPVLVAWAGGPAADALRGLDEPRLVERALDGLAGMLGIARGVPHDAIETWFTHDWMRDPLTRGAYSYALVGGAGAATHAATPSRGTLFFAGEHTAPAPNNGTVHGAIESGRRAASEVAVALPARRTSARGASGQHSAS